MTYYRHYLTPLGEVTLASDGTALTGLWFVGQKYDGAAGIVIDSCEIPLSIFQQTEQWLASYFSGEELPQMPAILLNGSPFQQAVWKVLLTIPWGSTMTYGQIARRMERENPGCRVSAQAVGGAVGHNPVSILVPCHRVVGADGSLTGYAGGLERKRILLQLEGVSFQNRDE